MKAAIPLVLTVLLAGCSAPEAPKVDRAAQSAALADRFQADLQGQLQAAMKAGGPIKALGVCQQAAPAIAAGLSQESGAEVRRISLKPRNPDAAVSGEMLAKLEQLDAKPMGDDGKPATAIWTSDGKTHWLRAIPMKEQPCAACHGTNVAPAVKAKVAELYPADKATGFKPGDLRGAIAISWPEKAK